MTDIALIVGCSVDTLERRFADVIETGRADVRKSLRRKQVELAMKGDRTMLIWLGKQLLGQRDEQRLEHAGGVTVTHDDEAIMAAAREYVERARIAGGAGQD
jgi:hypothetical protein